MNNSKGLAYTSFAILSAAILISMVFAQVYQPVDTQTANAERIGQASFFLDSVLSDMDRSLSIAARRSLTGANNYVVTEGEALKSAEENVSEIMVNGTLDGEQIETVGNASLTEWTGRVSEIAERSSYSISISVTDYSFSTEPFYVRPSFEVDARLKDPTTLASFNKTADATTSASLSGLEDPMITLRSKGRYTTTIKKCNFEKPAENILSAEQNSSTVAYGKVVLEPTDGEAVSNQGEKILAVEDPDSYSSDYTDDFEGVVAAQESSNPGQVNSDYALGTGSLNGVKGGEGIVIDSGEVWWTGFRLMFDNGCYLESERGPGFLDRLENKLVNDGSSGLETLIDVSELPSELQKSDSAVAFVYFNESGSYGSTESIKGVSDEYTWFRLDGHHVDKWNLDRLKE